MTSKEALENGNTFEVEEIWDTKVVLSYGDVTKLKYIITYVNEVYKLNSKGDYIYAWQKENKTNN